MYLAWTEISMEFCVCIQVDLGVILNNYFPESAPGTDQFKYVALWRNLLEITHKYYLNTNMSSVKWYKGWSIRLKLN